MRNDDTGIMIKLKDGVYYYSLTTGYNPSAVLFGINGIRSKGISIIINQEEFRNHMGNDIKRFVSSKISHANRIFFFVQEGKNPFNNIKNLGSLFREVSPRVMYIKEANLKYTQKQKKWISKLIEQMTYDSNFILGQIGQRRELKGIDSHITETTTRLAKMEDELKNLKLEEISCNIESTKKNILRMKWIDKIENKGEGLRILTKPMALTYVPNIGKFFDSSVIASNDLLYTILKNQCLGKYFIGLPEYYCISDTFGVKGENNTVYPTSPSRELLHANTYFHGVVPHIGNGQACVGELNGAIAKAPETGLDIFLMSFEVYLRSANLQDAAGAYFYVLPMGDAQGNIELWPWVEKRMKQTHTSRKGIDRTLEGYDKAIQAIQSKDSNGWRQCGYDWRNLIFYPNNPPRARDFGDDTQRKTLEANLELIHQREPKVYDMIKKRIEEGVVL